MVINLAICYLGMTLSVTFQYSSTLFILSMTVGRCYSIIRPHKSASFNTVRRAEITITSIVFFSSSFNSPHLFYTLSTGQDCVWKRNTTGELNHVLLDINSYHVHSTVCVTFSYEQFHHTHVTE